MRPNYTAKKSMWTALFAIGRKDKITHRIRWEPTKLKIGLLFLIIPIPFVLLWILFDMFRLQFYKIEFYDDKVVEYWGILGKHQYVCLFAGVLSVHVYRSLWGRFFNYGDLSIDAQGKWDFKHLYCMKNPRRLHKYLDQCRVLPRNMSFIASS